LGPAGLKIGSRIGVKIHGDGKFAGRDCDSGKSAMDQGGGSSGSGAWGAFLVDFVGAFYVRPPEEIDDTGRTFDQVSTTGPFIACPIIHCPRLAMLFPPPRKTTRLSGTSPVLDGFEGSFFMGCGWARYGGAGRTARAERSPPGPRLGLDYQTGKNLPCFDEAAGPPFAAPPVSALGRFGRPAAVRLWGPLPAMPRSRPAVVARRLPWTAEGPTSKKKRNGAEAAMEKCVFAAVRILFPDLGLLLHRKDGRRVRALSDTGARIASRSRQGRGSLRSICRPSIRSDNGVEAQSCSDRGRRLHSKVAFDRVRVFDSPGCDQRIWATNGWQCLWSAGHGHGKAGAISLRAAA